MTESPTTGGSDGVVLVADDDRIAVRIVKTSLSSVGLMVYSESDGLAAVQRARDLQPDVILLDVEMPKLDGHSACRQLREDPRTAQASIIMLTARSMPADKVVGLSAGADDFIVKPFDKEELVARVKAALRRSRQLRDVSPLTGLPGNASITRELEGLLALADSPFAVIYADLDNFKGFNDRYGFSRGDVAIKATAKVLGEVLTRFSGPMSFLGHIGGDDFVVLVACEDAEDVCAEIASIFDATVPELYDESDRDQGFIRTTDRQGNEVVHPLLSISMGVVSTQKRFFQSYLELSSVAAEMKKYAKSSSGSTWVADRRSE